MSNTDYNNSTEQIQKEIWVDIPNYEGLYQASSYGRIKALQKISRTPTGMPCIRKEKIFSNHYNQQGYRCVELMKDGVSKSYVAHRLIAISFLLNPYCKEQVNHIDGNKINNSVVNLEWVTASENQIHAIRNGLTHPIRGEKHPNSKLTKIHVLTIRQVWATGKYTKTFLGKLFSVDRTSIALIVNNKIWNHV